MRLRRLDLLVLGLSLLGCQPVTVDGLQPPVQEPPVTAPKYIRPLAGDSQIAPTGSLVPESLVVRVFDSLGNPFPGVVVDWNLPQAGHLGVPQTTTDETGTAKNIWQLGLVAGTQHAIASTGTLTPVDFVGQAIIVLQSITISPHTVTVLTAASQTFTTSGIFSDGTTGSPAVTYAATGGTVTTGGVYTAGSVPGVFMVIATSSNRKFADTAIVSVVLPIVTLSQIILSPSSASLNTGQSQVFTVSGKMNDGSTTVPSVNFQATGGTISPGGQYQAGSTPGTFRVIAVQQSGSLADTAKITIKTPGPGGPGNLFSQSFETGSYGELSNGGGSNPNSYSLPATGGFDGSRFALATLGASSSDQAANMFWNGDVARRDIWLIVAIKVIVPPSTGLETQKMVIFRQSGFNAQLGEMNQIDGNYIWNWLDGGHNIVITAAGKIANSVGQWNLWKFHLDGTGSRPILTVGLNGVDNIFTTTKPANKLADPAIINFGGTLNGGSGPSQFGFDYIQIGTVDPGWP